MALFAGKSDEEKGLERIAKALDGMMLRESDGKVHAGLFEIGGLSDIKATSATVDGVLSFMQERGYQIVDVKVSDSGENSLRMKVLVLYR